MPQPGLVQVVEEFAEGLIKVARRLYVRIYGVITGVPRLDILILFIQDVRVVVRHRNQLRVERLRKLLDIVGALLHENLILHPVAGIVILGLRVVLLAKEVLVAK